jgi:predicted nucleic acid-binding protein
MSAKKAGLISEVKPILDRMLEYGFRIKSTLYKKILEMVNE